MASASKQDIDARPEEGTERATGSRDAPRHGVGDESVDTTAPDTTAVQDVVQPKTADVPGSAPPRARSRGSSRWWLGVVVTTVIGLPLAWILSYAAALPFFIGVFFFVLVGLFVGAIAHRIAAAGRPYGSVSLVVGTTCIVLVMWGVTLFKEARDFPSDMATQAEAVRDIGDRTIGEFRAAVKADVRSYLAKAYPPGGALGYIQWVVRDGVFERGEIPTATRKLAAPQRGMTWVARVVLSAGLLAFGVGSQTLALRWQRDPTVRAIDAEPGHPADDRDETGGETNA